MCLQRKEDGMKQTLREIRESRGIKKGAVAKAVGVTYPTWQRYEEHPELMTVEQFSKACSALFCTPDDIFLPNVVN